MESAILRGPFDRQAWDEGLKGNGEAFTLEGLPGKWVLVVFCDARSEASRQVLRELEAFWSLHARDRERFTVVAVHAA